MSAWQIFERVLAVFNCVAALAIVGTFFVYYHQLRAMQRQLRELQTQSVWQQSASRGQNFFVLVNFLQTENIRAARAIVLDRLAKLEPEILWTESDSAAASLVCSSYDAAIIAYKLDIVPRNAFLENWGPSIKACYTVLRNFVTERQKQRGSDYWNDFQELGEVLAEANGVIANDG